MARRTTVVAVPGDVADPAHRRALVAAVDELGRLDLVVNNASVLGPSPQPVLAEYPLDILRQVFEVNAVAPLALIQLVLPLRAGQPGTHRQHHLGRGGRGLPGMGWLRLVQGGAGIHDQGPDRGVPGPPDLSGRSGRPAHPDAPGGLPRGGHLRPTASRGGRPRPAGVGRGAAAQRPLPPAGVGSVAAPPSARRWRDGRDLPVSGPAVALRRAPRRAPGSDLDFELPRRAGSLRAARSPGIGP